MNLVGVTTLLRRETARFLRVPLQALIQPLITAMLFFVVFGGALATRLSTVDGINYAQFIMPGLMMMTAITTSFQNCASSFYVLKFQGSVVDLLVAPMTPSEILFGFVVGGVVRGLIASAIVWVVGGASVGFHLAHPAWALIFLTLVAAAFASIGLTLAIVIDKIDQLNALPAILITPLTFLGGVFYNAQMLPEPWRTVTKFNPVLYMVEGLRFGTLGSSAESPCRGLAVVAAMLIAVLAVAWSLLATGYKLRR